MCGEDGDAGTSWYLLRIDRTRTLLMVVGVESIWKKVPNLIMEEVDGRYILAEASIMIPFFFLMLSRQD